MFDPLFSSLPSPYIMRRSGLRVSLLVPGLLLAFLAACSDPTGPGSAPVLTAVTPSPILVGAPGATLTLTGEGFREGSRARLGDADRPTRYVDGTTLEMTLTTADLAIGGVLTIRVVNPHGGGESATVTVTVGHPVPAITAVTPSSVNRGGPSVTLVITGTGFTPSSTVWWNGEQLTVTGRSATELQAFLSEERLQDGGIAQLLVRNPEPLGGPSSHVAFTVHYPHPVITAVVPDSATVGSPATLRVVGRGFLPGWVIRVNGIDRPTTFIDTTSLATTLGPSDVAVAATLQISVRSMQGVLSDAFPLVVRPAPPAITILSPSVLQAGGGDTTITITGSMLSSASVAYWNGTARPTQHITLETISFSVPASELATPGTARVKVVNGGTRESNTASLPILPPALGASVPLVVSLPNNHLVWDHMRGVFYVSVPASDPNRGNTITKVAPDGAILSSVFVGLDPGQMAIADDASVLYVLLKGQPAAVRVNLSTFTKELQFPLGSGWSGESFGDDIEVLPGLPGTVAISLWGPDGYPSHHGLAIFDDGVRRPQATRLYDGATRITRSPTAERLYSFDSRTSEHGFRHIVVSPHGVQVSLMRDGLIGGFPADIEHDGGLVYATTGAVIDPVAMQRLGAIPTTGVVRPDVVQGRVHYMSGTSIRTYHYRSFQSLAQVEHASFVGLTALVRWGPDGIAAGGGTHLSILRGSQFGQ